MLFKILITGKEKGTEQLRTLTAISEDLSLFPVFMWGISELSNASNTL